MTRTNQAKSSRGGKLVRQNAVEEVDEDASPSAGGGGLGEGGRNTGSAQQSGGAANVLAGSAAAADGSPGQSNRADSGK